MSYTTNVTPERYDSIQEAAEAIQDQALGAGGTIYDEDDHPVAQLGPDGLIVY